MNDSRQVSPWQAARFAGQALLVVGAIIVGSLLVGWLCGRLALLLIDLGVVA